jgi:hypothetical protein
MTNSITIPAELEEMIHTCRIGINGLQSLKSDYNTKRNLEMLSEELEKLLSIHRFIVDLQKEKTKGPSSSESLQWREQALNALKNYQNN